MKKEHFIPRHLNAAIDDLAGNNGIGRYILLPGSDGRAKEISHHFDNVTIKAHPRGHNLFMGTISCDGGKIDVAAIATGMGCPSMEIILHELYQLGGKRFLRIGTAGSLQPTFVKLGEIVNVQATVRDENTTRDYMPIEVPAIASLELIEIISLAAKKRGLTEKVHTGIVHCKSSLYAREFGYGPKREENQAYINLLRQCGVLASEMETATLFVQSCLYNYELMQKGDGPQHRVLAGAILGINAVPPKHIESSPQITSGLKNSIELALETIRMLAENEVQCQQPLNSLL